MKKILLLLFVAVAFLSLSGCKEKGAQNDGEITFIVIDENGNEAINDSVGFKAKKDDGSSNTLFDILKSNYNLKYTGTDSAAFVTGIEGVIADSSKKQFLRVVHNDVDAKVGISEIAFSNGDVIKFIITTW